MSAQLPQGPSVLVMLNVPPALEERVIDWLLARADDAAFTSHPAYGHSSNHDHLTLAEQVTGQQRRLEFRVELHAQELDAFLGDLRASFGRADLYYAVFPVLQSGHLNQ